ncbi:MAG: hypothetical protein K2L14_01660 [Duncaniella sp.]|nr:hypothetical protein [Duncaniella sp.]
MKKLLCYFIGAMFAAVSFAQSSSYEWLTFTLADGSEVAVAAENLSIDYAGGVLKLSSPAVNTSFEVQNLRSMRFTSGASGIAVAGIEHSCPAEYFTVAGVSAGTFNNADEARSALASGVYIVRTGTAIWKIMF